MTDEFSALALVAAMITLLAYVFAMRSDAYSGAVVTPLRLWAGLGILTSVPYMASLAFRLLRPDPLLEKALWAHEFDSLLLQYAILNAAGVMALIAGYRARTAQFMAHLARGIRTQIPRNMEMPIAFGCLGLGAVLWALMLIRAGGVWALVNNIQYRSQILSGAGYLIQFGSSFLTIGALLGFLSASRGRSRWMIAFWLAMLVLVALSLSVTGGRKGTIYLVIGAVIVWHYCVRPIRRLSVGLVGLGILLGVYFILVLSVRTLGGVEMVMYSPHLLLLAMRDSLSWMFANLSYVDTYVYVIAYFDKAGYWFGMTFLDLGSVWMPSSLMPDKPPVDDGVYLRSLAEGLYVEPGAALANMYPSSWPPETFGMGFMSFGVAGVLVFNLLLGSVIRMAIEFAREQEFSFFSVFLFAHVLLNFEITNLRLVQLLTTVVTLTGVLVLAALVRPFASSSAPNAGNG